MKTKRIIAIALVVVFAAMSLVACGGNEQSALERIQESGELVMLTNAAFPPFEYLGDDGEVAGVDAEIAAAIAEELGVELKIIDMDFDGIINAIQTGKGDLGVAGITADEERRKSVDFSINYVDAAQYIIVREDNTDIVDADSLSGKNVGVQLGTTGDIFVSDNTEAVVYQYKTAADAAVELANGKLDAVVIDDMPAHEIVKTYPTLKVVDEPLTEEQYAIAIKKGETELTEVVNKVLNELLESGQIDAWIEEHKAKTGA